MQLKPVLPPLGIVWIRMASTAEKLFPTPCAATKLRGVYGHFGQAQNKIMSLLFKDENV